MLDNLRMLVRFLRIFVTADPDTRVRRLYEARSPKHGFANRATRYVNFGYWTDDTTTRDEASERLAMKLAEAAGFTPDDVILDVGFGYGDQDFSWLKQRKIRQVYGLNVMPDQVEFARRRGRWEGLEHQTDFRVGSATEMPFEDGTFDRVVSLDAPFHFNPRSAFFKEAFRVLRPGGVLATTDLLPISNDTPRSGFKSLPLGLFISHGVPDANWYDRTVYAKHLAAAGFVDPSVTSIRDRVWEGWVNHMVRQVDDPAFQDAVGSRAARTMAKRVSKPELVRPEIDMLDYVIAVAHKL